MAAARRGIVTGGTWCVDNNRLVSFWPEEDGIVEILSQELAGGGSGCNLAVDIRHLDPNMPVETIAIVGDDEGGRFLRGIAEEAGIDHRQMHVDGSLPTQFTDAYASATTRRRTHLFAKAVAAALTPDHFDFSSTTGRILHLGLPGFHKQLDGVWEGGDNGWVTILKRARAAGLKTNIELASLETRILADTVMPCLDHLDYVVVNDTEIGALAGLPTVSHGVTDAGLCEAAARKVLEDGAMELVVVHWPKLAIAVTRDGTVARKASVSIPAELVVGANGAGDAFAAGMIYGVHEDWPLEKSLALAHATAACSLRSVTTSGSVVGWQETLRLADTWGWRT
ncbi:carbohydrate kinase family protein [Pleomorphomonas sp. JP5]|uniref:carbohydrate kinase family protein n=1 Tax=Pleomorphomonas sp. JP5 TaxID=2942998 RepID=UPI002042F00A|nr:carbohydrate kinase family protein [Pleomorphomonas sp. JP5]MCM5556709.1 carbohydrate kinase family protein [Pleomorphomonas sp. JP5]